MRSDVQHWVLCELRVLSRKVAAFEKQSRGVCVADTVCDDVLLLDGPQKVADVSIAQRISLDKCVISECLVLPFIPTFNAEIKPRVCNVPGTRSEFNANAVPFFPLAAEEIGIHVEASHGCSGNGFSGVRAPADMALNLALVSGLEDDLCADVHHAEAGSVPDRVSPEPVDLVVHVPGSTSSCSSLIGKRVHHNHRKATTQASVTCNLEGSTLRDHDTHHSHRNVTTQVPGRCNSEVSTLRDHGASRKDASYNHAAAVARWSAKLESLAKHPANVDSADLFGIRGKTTCSSMVSLFQVSSDEDVDVWMFEASSLKLTTRDYSVSLDSLPDISSNGVNALHADLFVKSVRHFVGTERANIFAETVADAACEAMLETWGRKVDVAALRSDYDHALVLLVELVASKVDAWRG